MNREIVHGLAALACLATSVLALPARAQAIQEYMYEPDRIYTARTGLGITTQIELSPNEKIIDYSTGFSSGWELNRRENVFYLKPRNVDVDTNMMVRTATHSYIFELKVVATDWRVLEQARREGVQYKVTFKYPNSTEFVAEADTAPALDTALASERVYNVDYDHSARRQSAWLVPGNVYDHGPSTHIRKRDRQHIPTANFPPVCPRAPTGN